MKKITKKDLEKDGEITLFKGKPFTGVYPYHFESEWDLVWDRPLRYYKDGKVVIGIGRYTLIAPELTEEEIDKGMQEIYGGLYFPLIKPNKKNEEWRERLNLFKNSKSKK